MTTLEDSERIDATIERFARIVQRLEHRQAKLERRMTGLYQSAAVAFGIVVVILSFLVLVFWKYVPVMNATIGAMNHRFAFVADDMVRMEQTIRRMDGDLGSFPRIIENIDHIHGSVGGMSENVSALGGSIVSIDRDMALMTTGVGDLRQSFEIMEINVGRIGRDVNHISKPMRFFNQINPLR